MERFGHNNAKESTSAVNEISFMEALLEMDAQDESGRPWRINDDRAAEWAIAKIKEAQDERDRLCALADAMIELYERERDKHVRQCAVTVDRLTSKLNEYFTLVPHKQTKTQETYKLLSGTLKLKRNAPERVVKDSDALIAWLTVQCPDALKITASPRWSVVNDLCKVNDGKLVMADTGEVLPGVELVDRPDTFEVVTNKTNLSMKLEEVA